MQKEILNYENISNYKKYRYSSEDNTFLTKIYSKIWNGVQTFIPTNIHPNIITLMGLFSVIIGYAFKNLPYGNICMGFAVFMYMNFDGLDGIHARKIKQTSVIGEYLDHLVDLCNSGMIVNALMDQFQISSYLSKSMFISGTSFLFMLPHFEAIYTKKIVFKGITDVSLFLTITILLFFLNIQMRNFNQKDELFLLIGISASLYSIYWLYKVIIKNYSEVEQKLEMRLPIYILLYYLIKNICFITNSKNNLFLSIITDSLILLEIINFKIFKKKVSKILVLIPILHNINSIITTVFVLYNVIQFILSISKQLDIALLKVRRKKLRVYCCGVFDLCHIGHMLLFEKIYKSFDEPIELIVGVHGDITCSGYKRPPIINENIRYKTVAHCKYVDSIYEDAPLVTDKDFVIKNRIDIVIIGEEYKGNKDKYWYPAAFDLSIGKYISRCDEISTSDIIKKIKSQY